MNPLFIKRRIPRYLVFCHHFLVRVGTIERKLHDLATENNRGVCL